MRHTMVALAIAALAALWLAAPAGRAQNQAASEPASEATRQAHRALAEQLPLEDAEDFALARRGLIARPEPLIIKDAQGRVIWDMTRFAWLKTARPDTVNPSLWRQAQLNMEYGLYQVAERIYQIRGYDLANMTLIMGDTGWIVVDPLTARETAAAALALADKHLGKRPVVAILSTHSHADHFGGIRALASQADIDEGRIRYIAPEHFVREAVSENVMAGNAMSRRATYMFGNLLPASPRGNVDSGLGKAVAFGELGLLRPSDSITRTGQKLVLDGVVFEFQLTPHAEAPAEFLFFLPQFQALCTAELVNGNMHNLYTPRGAKTRDALLWARHLTETLDLFGARMELAFGSHHWPRWGQDAASDYIAKQRDLYRYMHDQTVRLMNHGLTATEIAHELRLPPSLARAFYNRDYYGTLSHNVRAVYNFYLGYFDGVPAHLNPLPPQEAGKRYVALAGGASALMAQARAAHDRGEYRWAAELLNHLVFAEPQNRAAKTLLARSYEQMGYQAESAPWRNFYLTGAQELRRGIVKPERPRTASPDMIAAMPTSLFLDFMGVRFNPEGADDMEITVNFDFTDTKEQFVLALKNSVLNNIPNKQDAAADVTLKLTRALFNQVVLRQTSLPAEILKGNVEFAGNPIAFYRLFSRLDDFDVWFNIVTP